MRKPFIKFICHSASYFTFLFMLILASQRIETLFLGEQPADPIPTKRGSTPSLVEWIILAWVSGLIWSEIKQLWDVGLEEYVRDMWNVIDFITNSLYVGDFPLFETSQTLFWAVFGLIDLESFDLNGIKIFTRFWGMLMFGTYSVINIVVLLNLLIAMMNHSYQLISERADVEWKFARSKLWISYFEEGGTAPPPFNIIPTPKSIWYVVQWAQRKFCGHSKAAKKEHMKTIRRKVKQASERDFRYQAIMRNLVRRYVTVEQRKAENQGVTEDDVNEIKQDISAFRFELIEILKNSGMTTSTAHSGMGTGGKKNRQKERRLMKGFNIAPQPSTGGTGLPPVAEFIASLQQQQQESNDLFGSTLSNIFNNQPRRIQHSSTVSSSQGSINEGHHRGRCHMKRSSSHKRRWGTLIEAAKAGKVSHLIGRSRSEDSVCNSTVCRDSHNHNHSHSNSPGSDDNCTESATDSNPSLDVVPGNGHGHSHSHRDSGHGHGHSMSISDHFHGISSGLALLRKKRKKFSASRNTSPVVQQPPNPIEHAIAVCVGKSNKKVSQVLKRASSVPTRVPEVVQIMHKHELTQSQQDSVELPSSAPPITLTPSTTEESMSNPMQAMLVCSVGPSASSREPLLYSSSSNPTTGSSQTPEEEYRHSNGQSTMTTTTTTTSSSLPRLPGVIPLGGPYGPTGWL
ncbi:LOW QUALITY PROTEIN: transient receptor potential-gamma protein-like [Atheta coriaria]|uniref:LOW QUALITY PROTEIN: transient receptor potential-gamma protein-like n=1 Tax=Dalotia coriaria TaxID=877792 RepID=UPI0031F341CB